MPTPIHILHNPRCRKSRETLALIEEKGIKPSIRLYLDEPLTKAELIDLLSKLSQPASKLIRKSEPAYKENYRGKEMSEADWIEAMIAYPKLIERPIVIKGKKAVIGRPPENVIEIL